jgi:hypothetical protein
MTTTGKRFPMPPFTIEDVVSCLEDWGRTYAPSRFMVYVVTEDPAVGHDGDIIAWGLAFPDKVFVQPGHVFRSIERMRHILFRGGRDIRLLWIDPEPETGN